MRRVEFDLSRNEQALLRAIDNWAVESGGQGFLTVEAALSQLGVHQSADLPSDLRRLVSEGYIESIDVAEEATPIGVSGLTSLGTNALRKIRQADRLALLDCVYGKTGGDTLRSVRRGALPDALELPKRDVDLAEDYLLDERLVTGTMGGDLGEVSLTHAGVKECERVVSEGASSRFPSQIVQVFHGPVTNSQIQAGTTGSTQTSGVGGPELAELVTKLAAALRQQLPEVSIPSEELAELRAEVATLEAQSESPKPKMAIVQSSVRAIRDIAVSAAGSSAWAASRPEVLALIDRILQFS